VLLHIPLPPLYPDPLARVSVLFRGSKEDRVISVCLESGQLAIPVSGAYKDVP
jgi:hypothetical protein